MMEMVGGIISIVIGVIMLIIGGAVLNSIVSGSAVGNCNIQDYDGNGYVGKDAWFTTATGVFIMANVTYSAATDTYASVYDQATQAYKQCAQTRDSGFTVLNIMAVMLIIGGVLVSVRSFGSG